MNDPAVFPFLSTELAALLPSVAATGQVNAASSLVPSPLSSTINTTSLSIANQLASTWSSSAASAFLVATLAASSASVVDSNGKPVGTGSVMLTASAPVAASVSGTDQYKVNGTGSLSFYGPAETSLGVSGNWSSYSASVTGGVAITLTTSGLTLNDQAIPAGTYTITTSSATLTGSGPSTSPNFSGSASITTTSATVDLGPASGTLTTGGKPLDPKNGVTLTGYTGTLTVSANGDGTDSATLNGNAGNVLTVSANPATLTTDQNTPVTFAPDVQTSLADTYTLTAQAPPG